jgi:streptogramin lyase
LLTGCSASFAPAPSPSRISLNGIQGTVYGGQQPVNLSHVYVYAAGTGGYGGASQSLLTAYSSGNFPTTEDANGNYYVTTNARGFFSLTGEYACTAGQDVYIYATGGNTGGGSNSALGLLAVFGTCPAAGTFANVLTKVQINELSTVASAYALSGFAVDSTHIADDEAVAGNATAAQAQAGMANAFAAPGNLVSLTGGYALSTTPNGNGTVPAATINTLGDILAGCINSADSVSGSTVTHSADCQSLFALATSDGTPAGTQPNDTASAAINIAHHPAANTVALFDLTPNFPPFPALETQPNDFSLSITYTDPSLSAPYHLAVDASGNVWITNTTNAITEFTSLGVAATGSPFTGGGLDSPFGIAIDKLGEVWVTDSGTGGTDTGGLTELSSTGTASANSPLTGNGLDAPTAISIDGQNNVWAASPTTASGGTGVISGFTRAGVPISTGTIAADDPLTVANDGAGNVFFDNGANNTGYVYQESSSCSPMLLSEAGDFSQPYSLAVDSYGHSWTLNLSGPSLTVMGNTVCEMGGSGTQSATNLTGGGLSTPLAITLDGSGNVWIANGTNSLSEFSNAGTAITSASNLIKGAGLNRPTWIAADGSGNLWLPNNSGNSVTEFIGIATPVITPLAAGLPSTFNTTGVSSLATRP